MEKVLFNILELVQTTYFMHFWDAQILVQCSQIFTVFDKYIHTYIDILISRTLRTKNFPKNLVEQFW